MQATSTKGKNLAVLRASKFWVKPILMGEGKGKMIAADFTLLADLHGIAVNLPGFLPEMIPLSRVVWPPRCGMRVISRVKGWV
jgi:hypothetical protein